MPPESGSHSEHCTALDVPLALGDVPGTFLAHILCLQAVRRRLPPPESGVHNSPHPASASKRGRARREDAAVLEPSEGPHITPEDYVAQDEIFKVGPAARCWRGPPLCKPDVVASWTPDGSASCPVKQACFWKPMANTTL